MFDSNVRQGETTDYSDGTRVNSRKRHDDDTPAAPVSPAQSLTSFPARTVPSQLPSEGSSALKPQRGDQKQAGSSLLHPRRRVEPSRNSILLLRLLLHRDAQFQCGGGKSFQPSFQRGKMIFSD